MTGGQMAPTTLVGMKTATCPYGRDPEIHGYPLKMTEIAATLQGTCYVTRLRYKTVCSNCCSHPQGKESHKKSIRKFYAR